MSDLHIDDFYRDVAKILVILYGHFPSKMTLFIDDIAGPDTPDEFGLHSPRHLACLHTMLWLGKHGYLNYEQLVRQEAIDQVALTQIAFLLLTQFVESPPQENGSSELPTFISRLRYELKSGTSFSIAALVRSLLENSQRYRAP